MCMHFFSANRRLRIPMRNVMAAGLSLAETYDMCCKYIKSAGLDMHCDCMHFDPGCCLLESDWR